MPQNKHKSWCGAQHQQATKDADGPGEEMAKDKKNDQEWTYLGTGTKKDFPTSFDKHIAGRHTGKDAEATPELRKKKGRSKISPGLQRDWAHTDSREDGPIPILFQELNPAYFEERIHSSSARSVIDLCPGSGEALASICAPIPCMGQLPIPFMGPRTGRRSRVEQQPFSIRCKQPLRVSNHLP